MNWKENEFYPMKNFEEYYEINTNGDIRSFDRRVKMFGGFTRVMKGRIRRTYISNGYVKIDLTVEGKVYRTSLHRLVALQFIPNPENKSEVNHKDGNKLNNHVSNLEWVTTRENELHAYKTGLKGTGEKHPNTFFKDEDIIAIRQLASQGISKKVIARLYNTRIDNIYRYVNKTRWTHL